MTKTKTHGRVETEDKDIRWRLIRLYILHRAEIEPVLSIGIVEKLNRHGLKLSTGSVSQILGGLERRGYLVSATMPKGRPSHKAYRTTGRGRAVIMQARKKIRQLFAML